MTCTPPATVVSPFQASIIAGSTFLIGTCTVCPLLADQGQKLMTCTPPATVVSPFQASMIAGSTFLIGTCTVCPKWGGGGGGGGGHESIFVSGQLENFTNRFSNA